MILSGKIAVIDYDEDCALKIGDEYLAEVLEEFHGKQVNVIYFISDAPVTIQQVLRRQLNTILGVADAELHAVYSDVTGFLWVDEKGFVGGHDLLDIFYNHTEEYGWLIISEDPIDLASLA